MKTSTTAHINTHQTGSNLHEEVLCFADNELTNSWDVAGGAEEHYNYVYAIQKQSQFSEGNRDESRILHLTLALIQTAIGKHYNEVRQTEKQKQREIIVQRQSHISNIHW